MTARSLSRSCLQLSASTSTSSSVARTFLQLAPRRCLHGTPVPLLDFLVPSAPSPSIHNGWASVPASRPQQRIKRSFATTAKRQQTTAIFNPRQDDNGVDMSVEITPRASNRLKEIMSKDSNPNLALRIQVESGGCHGFQYLMSLTTLPPTQSLSSYSIQGETSPADSTPSKETARSLEEDDTVFAAGDGSGAKVVMDGPSLELLKGSKIDFTMELIGSQFKIVDNPLATSSCGCGTSFDIKV